MWCAACMCVCTYTCMTACIVRIQFSGNELLQTGLEAHDITNSLNFTAKTNSGSCFGLCWISLPPWLCFSFTWKSLLKFVPKEAGGRGCSEVWVFQIRKCMMKCCKRGVISNSEGQQQQTPVRGDEDLWFAKVFHLGLLVDWSQDGRREELWGC